MAEERVRLDWLGPAGVTFYSTGTEIIASYQGLDLVVGNQVVTLNTGGRHTPIMQYRINQITRQLDLPLEIIIRGGEWWVRTPTRAYRFVHGMELHLGPGREELR